MKGFAQSAFGALHKGLTTAVAVYVAIVLGLCRVGLSCGPAVHNEVAERARAWFREAKEPKDHGRVRFYREILDNHPEALQAGVIFPDWGYGCLSMDDQSEAAHWTPFLRAGVEHYREKYAGKHGTNQAKQLIAFLFGVASHQVADEQWHSLSGLDEGIMWVLARSTFGGEFSKAHDTLDVGGDFALAHMDDLAYMLDKWTVPMDDVVAIYRRLGYSVSRLRLRVCITRQFYAMEAVKRFGRGLFPSYAAKAPMLTEQVDDYYIGGLFAMAASTSDCWHSLVEWLDSGNATRLCLVNDYREPHAPKHGHGSRTPARAMLAAAGAGTVAAEDWVEDGQLHIRAGMAGKKAFGYGPQHAAGERSMQPDGADECQPLTALYPKAKAVYTTEAYSGFGAAIALGDFSGAGHVDVAIGAPHHKASGAVFVMRNPELFYSNAQQDVADTDALVLTPPAHVQHTRFGAELAVVDINCDGIDDLAVGSPTYGDSLVASALGHVDIYLGRKGLGLSPTPEHSIAASHLARHANRSRVRIGGHLFGEDVDGDGCADLVIGAPYHGESRHTIHEGRVFAYLSAKRREPGKLGPPDFVVESPQQQPGERFGSAVKTVRLPSSGKTALLIGAPGHAPNATAGGPVLAGRVYLFATARGSEPEYTGINITSDKSLAQLGSTIHLWANESPVVLFGTPSEKPADLLLSDGAPADLPERGWQAGEVRVVDPERWLGGSSRHGGLLRVLRGKQSPGHFGVAMATAADDVWIGEPFGNDEDGRVYRWRLDSSAPECFYMANAMGKARLGQRVAIKRNLHREVLVLSQPHDSQFGRLTGSVLVLQRPAVV